MSNVVPGYETSLPIPPAPVLENDVDSADLALRTYWQNAVSFGLSASALDNSAALQKALNFCRTNGLNLYIPAGRYYFTAPIILAAGGGIPSIVGDGKEQSILDFSGCADIGFQINGGSGGVGYYEFSRLGFYGHNSHPIFRNNGLGGVRWRLCEFECAAVDACIGILWENRDGGAFTEFNVADNCHFGYNLKRAIKYNVVAGNDSFHGTGLMNCLLNTASPAIEIGAGCNVYNAPLSLHGFTSGDGSAFILNNSAFAVNFSGGALSFEGNVLMASGNAVFYTGSIHSSAGFVKLGTMALCSDMFRAGPDHGNIFNPVLKPFSRVLSAQNGNNLFTGVNVGIPGSDVWVNVEGPNLAVRRLYYCENQGYGGAGAAVLIATGMNVNSVGLSQFDVSVDINGRVNVALAGLPAGAYNTSIFVTPRNCFSV